MRKDEHSVLPIRGAARSPQASGRNSLHENHPGLNGPPRRSIINAHDRLTAPSLWEQADLLRVPGLAEKLRAVLCDPLNGKIKIKFGEILVNPDLLCTAGHAIEKGKVKIAFIRDLPYPAKYIEAENVLVTAFSDVNNLLRRSAVVHEAVHIISDMRRLKKDTLVLDHEMVAYTVQFMYLRLQGKQDNAFGEGANQPLLDAAFALADHYLAQADIHPGDARRLPSRLDPLQETHLQESLRREIRRVDVYKERDEYKRRLKLDGLHR